MHSLSPQALFDLKAFAHAKIFDDCHYAWEALPKISDYLESETLGQVEVAIPDGVHLINPHLISIGEGTVVEKGAFIKGPCIIGRGCQVRPGAYIRGNLITGDGCVLGHGSEFKNALLLNDAKAAHFAYVGDSILGNSVNLGAGTILANLRLDRAAVKIAFEGEKITTGLKKLGALLGDTAETGCNAVLNPGTIFEKGAVCFPCKNMGGFVRK